MKKLKISYYVGDNWLFSEWSSYFPSILHKMEYRSKYYVILELTWVYILDSNKQLEVILANTGDNC